MVTIEENWHWYTEHQAIYNIHTINSSYEIMSVLEYQVFSLWDIYPPPDFSSFFLFPLGCLILFLGVIAGEASKNSIRCRYMEKKPLP